MVKLSELRSAEEIHEQDMRDLDYRREHERTRLASDVAVRVIRYRADHGLSQAALARQLGMRQPHIARLEAGDHEPSLSTLARLSAGLGLDFSVDVKPDRMRLRHAAG
ncbi:MAG: helix-turn-helix domain-containing protein [Actinomycetota bacterium]|nr:helix-turn-helix domain-containing protein [Actinomycetota bacterium]